jgi:hypothetical protein
MALADWTTLETGLWADRGRYLLTDKHILGDSSFAAGIHIVEGDAGRLTLASKIDAVRSFSAGKPDIREDLGSSAFGPSSCPSSQ